jgi:hypothetical protein
MSEEVTKQLYKTFLVYKRMFRMIGGKVSLPFDSGGWFVSVWDGTLNDYVVAHE